MNEYTTCDQCMKSCSVEALQCDIGKEHYREVTGREYVSPDEANQDGGAAFRRMLRERRNRERREASQENGC